MVSKKKVEEITTTTTTTTEKQKRVSKKKVEEITTTTTEKPKRKRTTKAEKAEIKESKSKQPENITQEKFTAEISGRQCEGIMVKFSDRSIYLCQDYIVGGFINKKLRQGYKFSIFVGNDKITSPLVKNFKIIP